MSTIGVLGGRWRASVSPAGAIQPWDDSPALDWYIAADDRWHVPAQEPAVRQRRLEGTPVLETRVRIPEGDAVQRVWCVADHGGFTVVEIENDSSLPFAVAFSRGDLLSVRPPANVPIEGISLPDGAVVFPVGHRSTVQVALRHGPGATSLPADLASAAQVARGWTATIDRAGRLLVPDEFEAGEIARLRSELALVGPADPAEDPLCFLMDVGLLVRLGERAADWVPDVAEAVERAARRPLDWAQHGALDAAALVLARADESRALRDLARLRPSAASTLAPVAPEPPRRLHWYEQRLARVTGAGTAELMAGGFPSTWLGANFEVYDLPVGPQTTISYALRWHGDRPALLWEMTGPPVRLSAGAVSDGWTTSETKGEALWPAPRVASPTDVSFN